MNYTENYQLPQWEENDRILMADFNAMTQKIEAGLTGKANAADLAALEAAVGAAVPAGTIAAWKGAADAVPAGWALCDGANGTPDLRGRFLVGAGGDYAVGDTGGAATEELNDFNRTGGSVLGTIYAYTTSLHDNRPPYYALCFIMKL